MAEASARGWPLVRPLWLHYPDDPETLRLDRQLLLGSELLVSPALEPGVDAVDVYLPAGRWVSVWDGAVRGDPATGVRVRASAPIGRPAVFHREGSAAGARLVEALDRLGLR